MDHKDLIRAAECCDLKDCEVCPSKGRVCCRERTMQELAAALKNEILRAKAAEARALALETTHSTEMCEDGWDCAALGRARKAQEAAEARAEKAEARIAEIAEALKFGRESTAMLMCFRVARTGGQLSMERLTTRNRNGTIGIGEPLRPYNYEDIKGILSRLADIEDILGDDYDLDRLDVMVNQCMTMREEVAERFSTTCNIPVARLRELVEADREGRVRIHARPNDHTCGSCVHFRRITGRCCGTCTIQSRYRDKYGREDDRRGTFTPSQSRKACRWYEKNVGEET